MADDRREFQNPYWHVLAAARPRLHDQAAITRQEIRGRLWHVIEDRLSGRQFRLTPEAWYFTGLLDGRRTVAEAMDAARGHLGETAPGQGEVLRLLTQLQATGVLSSVDSTPDPELLYARGQKARRQRLLQQIRSPLAIRIALIDPDRLLEILKPVARLIFSAAGALVWLCVVGYGLSVALLHYEALSHNFLDRFFSAENLLLMSLAFAVMKIAHELGHGLAVKRWGGEVHEAGVMFLVLIPIPYVDATAANAFTSRFSRVVVSAAGMYVEMFLAAIAVVLWASVEPGLSRSVLYSMALVGSISTLLFNINPLLRFDGYYILADALQLPNLATRARRLYRYFLERWVLGLDDAATPETSIAEKAWLATYQVLAFVYRLFIIAAIAFFVAQKFFFVGAVLAIWAVAQMVLVPVIGALKFLIFSPRLRRSRFLRWGRAALAISAVTALLGLVPVPLTTATWGVVWVPNEGEIVAISDGFVAEIVAHEGAQVSAGDVLIVQENATLETELERLEARRQAMEARYRAEFGTDRLAAQLTRMELGNVEERIAVTTERLEGLKIRSAVDGVFALAVAEDMIGRYVRRGDLLGFVLPSADASIRVAITQSSIGLVRDDTRQISIMPVRPFAEDVPARLVRAVPSASGELPSMSLSTRGGGEIVVVDDGSGVLRATEDLFHFEIMAVEDGFESRVGEKVHVKFTHSPEPVAIQLWRRLRQLFLSKLEV